MNQNIQAFHENSQPSQNNESAKTPSLTLVDSSSNERLRAALGYARRGWHVFPLVPNCKVPFKGTTGFKSATTDRDQIIAWWTQQPEANVGIRTGLWSGILVIDIDPQNGGDKGLADLERVFGPMPDTMTASTPSGGRHYLFQYPKGFTVASSANAIAPGIDVRADGGYIVAAPSTVKGRAYAWSGDSAASLPGWLLGKLHSQQSVPQVALVQSQDEVNLSKISFLGSLTPPLDTLHGPLTSEQVNQAYRGYGLRLASTLVTITDAKMSKLSNGGKVSVRSPLREDKHPSGGLIAAPGGRLVFKDFAENSSYSLPALRAAMAYGKPKEELKLSKAEYFIWALRLLHETGLVTPANVDDLPPCPDDACEGTRKVYDGFKLLVGLQRRCQDAWTRTAFSKRFAAAWCGVSEATAHRAKLKLMELRVISMVGVHNLDKPGKRQCGLFMPGKVRGESIPKQPTQDIRKRINAACRQLEQEGRKFDTVDASIDALAEKSGIDRLVLTKQHGMLILQLARRLNGYTDTSINYREWLERQERAHSISVCQQDSVVHYR